MNQQLPLAVYYEHPEWFRPLFAELDRRSIQYLRIDAGCHGFDASEIDRKYGLFFNRMSASAYLRGNAQGVFFTRDYLAHLERIGTRVINAAKPFPSRFRRQRNSRSYTHWDWLRRARVS